MITGATTSTISAPPAASVPPASLHPEFYYALFRAGVPADADALFQTQPATVSAIWTQAVTQGVIPKSLSAAIPQAVQTFQALAGAHLLTMPPKLGISTISDLVAPTLGVAGQPAQFAALLAAHAGDWTTLWSEVDKTFGTATRQKLQLVGQLSYLTLDNAPLLTALNQAEARNPLTAPIDLAARGYWDAAKWTPLVGQSVPSGVPGATPQEKAANYSAFLAAQVKLSFPTATLAQQVKSGAIPLASTPAAAGDAADFLAAHQADFAFGVEPVETYIARNKLTPSSTAVFHLKRLQRVYQMTTSDQALSALLTGNVDSAFAITRYDSDGFVRAFSAQVGGDDVARAIHSRARQIHGVTLNVDDELRHTARLALARPRTGDIWPSPPSGGGNGSGQTVAAATLDGLFGSLDTCGCDDCESILSPSAYLVDLLHYLDQPAAKSGANPQTILFGRRPDLQYLPLTCENTEVALPYIDVVNETLEYFVANGLAIDGFQGFDTGDQVTSAELVAAPQNVNDAAYTALQGAFFPAPLPFNRPLALLRAQMGALSVSTPDAMELLRKGDATAVSPPTGSDYGWNDILIERLGISRDEMRIFVDPALQLGDLVGMPTASALATLRTMSVHDLVRRTQITYDDLVAILQTQFVNPNAALIPKLERLGAPFATIKALHDNPAVRRPDVHRGPATQSRLFAIWRPDLDQRAGRRQLADQRCGLSQRDQPDHDLQSDHRRDRLQRHPTAAALRQSRQHREHAERDGLAQAGALHPSVAQAARRCSAATTRRRFSRPMRSLRRSIRPPSCRPSRGIPRPTPPTGRCSTPGSSPRSSAPASSSRRPACSGLIANAALPSLLACAAPIGTTGTPSFYQSLFATPTLNSIDPGAQIATLTGHAVCRRHAAHHDRRRRTSITWSSPAKRPPRPPPRSPPRSTRARQWIRPRACRSASASMPSSRDPRSSLTPGFVVTVPPRSAGRDRDAGAGDRPSDVADTDRRRCSRQPGDVVQFAIDSVPISYTVAAGDTLGLDRRRAARRGQRHHGRRSVQRPGAEHHRRGVECRRGA